MLVSADHLLTTSDSFFYLLWATQGEYDDRQQWPLHAYDNVISADWVAQRLEKLWADLRAYRDKLRDEEPEDAHLADDYDWQWAEKKALRSRDGREFAEHYGARPIDLAGLLVSSGDLSIGVARIEIFPSPRQILTGCEAA